MGLYADELKAAQRAVDTDISKEDAVIREKNTRDDSAFTRGAKRGYHGLVGTVHGLRGAVNSLTGDKVARDAAFRDYQARQRTAGQFKKETTLMGDEGTQSALQAPGTFLAETLGEAVPSLAEFVATGAAGAAIGSQAVPGVGPEDVVAAPVGFLAGVFAKGAIKKKLASMGMAYATRQLVKEGGKELAEQTLKKMGKAKFANWGAKQLGGRVGSFTALTAIAGGQEGGGNWAELYEKGIDAPGSSLAMGVLSGASESLLGATPGMMKVFQRPSIAGVLKRVNNTKGVGAAAGVLWDMAKQGGEEGLQEGVQELLSMINMDINDPDHEWTKESFKQLVESAAAGAVVGGVTGGAGGVKQQVGQRFERQTPDAGPEVSDEEVESVMQNMEPPEKVAASSRLMARSQEEFTRFADRNAEIFEDPEFQAENADIMELVSEYIGNEDRHGLGAATSELKTRVLEFQTRPIQEEVQPQLEQQEVQEIDIQEQQRQQNRQALIDSQGDQVQRMLDEAAQQQETKTQAVDTKKQGKRIDKSLDELDKASDATKAMNDEDFVANNQELISEIQEAIAGDQAGLVVEKVNLLKKKMRNFATRERRKKSRPYTPPQTDGTTQPTEVGELSQEEMLDFLGAKPGKYELPTDEGDTVPQLSNQEVLDALGAQQQPAFGTSFDFGANIDKEGTANRSPGEIERAYKTSSYREAWDYALRGVNKEDNDNYRDFIKKKGNKAFQAKKSDPNPRSIDQLIQEIGGGDDAAAQLVKRMEAETSDQYAILDALLEAHREHLDREIETERAEKGERSREEESGFYDEVSDFANNMRETLTYHEDPTTKAQELENNAIETAEYIQLRILDQDIDPDDALNTLTRAIEAMSESNPTKAQEMRMLEAQEGFVSDITGDVLGVDEDGNPIYREQASDEEELEKFTPPRTDSGLTTPAEKVAPVDLGAKPEPKKKAPKAEAIKARVKAKREAKKVEKADSIDEFAKLLLDPEAATKSLDKPSLFKKIKEARNAITAYLKSEEKPRIFKSENNTYYLHKATRQGVEWQLSTFTKDEQPLGHTEYKSYDQAIDDLTSVGVSRKTQAEHILERKSSNDQIIKQEDKAEPKPKEGELFAEGDPYERAINIASQIRNTFKRHTRPSTKGMLAENHALNVAEQMQKKIADKSIKAPQAEKQLEQAMADAQKFAKEATKPAQLQEETLFDISPDDELNLGDTAEPAKPKTEKKNAGQAAEFGEKKFPKSIPWQYIGNESDDFSVGDVWKEGESLYVTRIRKSDKKKQTYKAPKSGNQYELIGDYSKPKTKGEQIKAKVKAKREKAATTLDPEFVRQAYAGTSTSPRSAAKAEQESFDRFMEGLKKDALEYVEDNEDLQTELDFIAKEYIRERKKALEVRRDTVSGHVAGRSKFNTKQAARRNSALDRAEDNFSNWQKRISAEFDKALGIDKIKAERQQSREQAKKDAREKTEQAAKSKRAKQVRYPIINDPEYGTPITKEEWKKTHSDFKSVVVNEQGEFRYRSKIINSALTPVYITDQKEVKQPSKEAESKKPSEKVTDVTEKPNPFADLKELDEIKFNRGGRDYTRDIIKVLSNGEYQVELFGIKRIKPSEVLRARTKAGEVIEATTEEEVVFSRTKEFWQKTIKELNEEKKANLRNIRERSTDIHGVKWANKSEKRSKVKEITEAKRYHEKLLEIHQERIQEAIDEGKTIPPEVLKDYPGLVAKPAEEAPTDTTSDFDTAKKPNPQAVAELTEQAKAATTEKLQDTLKALENYKDDQAKVKRKIVQDELDRRTTPAKKAEAKEINDVKSYNEVIKRINSGDITADELRAAFKSFTENRQVFVDFLQSKTKAQIARASGQYRDDSTKPTMIKTAVDRFAQEFIPKSPSVSGFTTFSMTFGESTTDAVNRQIKDITDADLAKIQEKTKEVRAKQAEEKQARLDAVKDPKTLSDFRIALDEGVELTEEQQARYDDLATAARRERTKERKEAQRERLTAPVGDVGMSIVEAYHDKKDIPMFVVQQEKRVERDEFIRLKAIAKANGGYWSRYRGGRAEPGFQFTSQEDAQTFIDNAIGEESTATKEAVPEKTGAEKLREVAEGLMERGVEKRDQDRKDNTSRRAGMAASAIADAERDIAIAKTMQNIAESIENDTATHLKGLKNKTQIETLISVMFRARTEYVRDNDISYEKSKELPMWQQAYMKYVKYPNYELHYNTVTAIARELDKAKGGKRAAQYLRKWAKEGEIYKFTSKRDLDVIETIKKKLKDEYMVEWVLRDSLDIGRLERMDVLNAQELRAAIREFDGMRESQKAEDPIKKLERDIKTDKFEGLDFFPTPIPLANRMVEMADIEPGMKVLEPSAGKGDIAKSIQDAHPDADVTAVEVSGKLREIIKAKGLNLSNDRDFLEHEGEYDRIVMNPPFSKNKDVEHVRHAYSLLKPGGKIVAIVSEHPFFANDKVSKEFREWFDEVGVSDEKMQDAFKGKDAFRQTGVNTRLIEIEKPASEVKYSVKEFSSVDDIQDKWKDKVDSLFLSEDDNYVKLMNVVVGKGDRKQGIGTAIMEDIVSYADQAGKVARLTPALQDDRMGTTSKARLKKFYKRFGFVENKGRNKDFVYNADEMYRDPQGDVKFSLDGSTTRTPITSENVQESFPGSEITNNGDDYTVALPSGAKFNITMTKSIPTVVSSIMRDYGVTREVAERMAISGAKGATVPSGATVELSDGKELSLDEINVIIQESRGDSGTVRHEGLHVAKQLGFFDSAYGKSLWDSLMLEYGSEENIANAREVWTGQNGLWGKIVQWFQRLKLKLGMEINPNAALNETFTEQFWSQGVDRSKVSRTQFSSIDQTDTPEFKKWFGDSKVVDEDGEPLVLYHGSDEEFTSFDKSKAQDGRWGKGFYFADNADTAKKYGKNIMKVYVKADKLFSMDTNKTDGSGKSYGVSGTLFRDGGLVYMVDKPTQIKSATDNIGTFDPQNPDIRFSADPVTSIKNDVVDDLREQRRAGEITAVEAESQQMWLDHAETALNNDFTAGARLLNELTKESRVLSDRETAILQVHYRREYNVFEQLSDKLFEAQDSGDAGSIAIAQTAVNNQLVTVNGIEEVARSAGREWGRAGVARQIALKKDFSLAGMERKARVANGGKALNKEQMQEIKKLSETVERLEKRILEESSKVSDLEKQVAIKSRFEEEVAKSKKLPKRQKPKKAITAGMKIGNVLEKLGFSGMKEKVKGLKFKIDEDADIAPDEESMIIDELMEPAIEMAKAYNEWGITSVGAFIAAVRSEFGETSTAAELTFAKAWNDMASKSNDKTISGGELDITDAKSIIKEARSIQRELIQNGILNNIPKKEAQNTVIDAVHKTLQESIPDMSRGEAIDALSGYGQFSTPSKNEIDIAIRELNALHLQVSKQTVLNEAIAKAEELREEGLSDDEIAKRLVDEGLQLKATGYVRGGQTDLVRHMIAQTNELKKELPVLPTAKEGQLQSALDAAKKTTRNRIKDLQWEISNKERIVKVRKSLKADKELEALRKERDELVAEHRQMFPAKARTEAQRIAAAESALDKAIARTEQEILSGDIGVKKVQKVSTPAIDAKRARLDELKAQKQALRDIANPKMTPEQRALKNYEANILRRVAGYQDRIAEKDFAPRKKETRELSDAELKLKKRLEDAKIEFMQKSDAYRRANLSLPGKALDYAKEIGHISRSLMTSMDLSAVFRQGGIAVYSHPALAKKASKEMFKALASEQNEFNSAEKMRQHPLWQKSQTAKLAITTNEGQITKQDESFMGRWADRVPGVAGSGRAYTTFLNSMRFNLFVTMVDSIGKNGQVTTEEAKVIANYINAATGRADFKRLNETAATLNSVFFAPRYVASRFQYLAIPFALPWMNTTPRVKKMIAQEYARTFAGAAVFIGSLLTLAAITADGEEEEPRFEIDPRSTDFMKIRVGDTRIDPLAGLSQVIVFSSKVLSGQTKSAMSGEVKSLSDVKGPFGQTRWSVTGRFLRGKLGPIPGATVTTLNDFTDVVGQKHSPAGLTAGLFIPLSIREVRDSIVARGYSKGTAISMMALFGMSVGTYGKRSDYLAADKAEKAKIFAKDLKKVNSQDKHLPYQDKLTREQLKRFERAKLRKKKAKKKDVKKKPWQK